MVHENFIKKEKEEKHEQLPEESKESNPDIPNNILRQSTKQREENFKGKMHQEINKLKFNDDAQAIDAVQQVQNKEQKLEDSKKNQQKDNQTENLKKILRKLNCINKVYFTSLHQAAAEVAFNHMRYVVAKRKLMRKIEKMEQNEEQDMELASQQNQDGLKIAIPDKNSAINLDARSPSKHSLQNKKASPMKQILEKELQSREMLNELQRTKSLVKKSTKKYQKIQTKKELAQNRPNFNQSDNSVSKSSVSDISHLDTQSIENLIEQEMISKINSGLIQQPIAEEEFKDDEPLTNRTDKITNHPDSSYIGSDVREQISYNMGLQSRARQSQFANQIIQTLINQLIIYLRIFSKLDQTQLNY